ncbi:sigma-E processing peptidase SpoIIGA [Desmospora profundinema]|uniref:Sporulation sigma-E factor-processing peptidase n=1 Tax=Desmospora profundinema TaxID=1571184 RepID=A0ABU1IJ40_9BACL|nr:sigma-E processing peptidase SpoIIGA [Desmospora profundinema]MDR6224792.1 stage II sporulation protein GA (sporulation sigma-E factor processing peptidase) [Desmospora profundinema]
MVVYADMVFLLNLCIDGLLLWLTAAIRRQRTPYWRIAVAAVIGATYAVWHLWQPLTLAYTFGGKLFVSILMVGVAMGLRAPLAFLRNLGVFYLISFVTGGGMFALHYLLGAGLESGGGVFVTYASGWGSPVSWVFVLAAFPLVWLYARVSFRSLQDRQAVHQYLATVAITVEGVRLECVGLIDTGNQLRDPISRTPVMMVELGRLSEVLPDGLIRLAKSKDWDALGSGLPPDWLTRVRLVPYRGAAGDGGMMLAFKPDRVDVHQKGTWVESGQVLIGLDAGRLSSDGTYQAILHPSTMPAAG